jgi:hypothetical protein
MADLTPTQRNLISRGTMLVFGLLLLWSGIKCFMKASDLREQEHERLAKLPAHLRHSTDYSGANWATFAGVILFLPGGLLTAGAVTPTSVLHRMTGMN